MGFQDLIAVLGDEIHDPDEESFSLFTTSTSFSNLGFLDPKSSTVSLSVHRQDLTIHQSPTLLSSSLPGGTTGAVVWKITPLFAEWVSSPSNPLFKTSVLGVESIVLELGAGVSGLVALGTAPRVQHYVATDQEYVMKLLRRNVTENLSVFLAPARVQNQPRAKQKKHTQPASGGGKGGTSNITLLPLDWDNSSISSLPSHLPPPHHPQSQTQALAAIFALDCIYNESLIPPFVRTCVELARLRSPVSSSSSSPSYTTSSNLRLPTLDQPTLVVIAQQLRSPSVFEEWLREFMQSFRAWRVPDEMFGDMKDTLGVHAGFVMHIGVLKEHLGDS